MSQVRTFETGANRSPDAHRDDPEGFLSPLVIDRYNQYMTKNRKLPDGSVRDSDNWQKGIPLTAYMKGAWRHFLHWWTRHRNHPVLDPGAAADIEEDLCALMFNVMGYLHETVKARLAAGPVTVPFVFRFPAPEEDVLCRIPNPCVGYHPDTVRIPETIEEVEQVERKDKDGFYAQVGRKYGIGL